MSWIKQCFSCLGPTGGHKKEVTRCINHWKLNFSFFFFFHFGDFLLLLGKETPKPRRNDRFYDCWHIWGVWEKSASLPFGCWEPTVERAYFWISVLKSKKAATYTPKGAALWGIRKLTRVFRVWDGSPMRAKADDEFLWADLQRMTTDYSGLVRTVSSRQNVTQKITRWTSWSHSHQGLCPTPDRSSKAGGNPSGMPSPTSIAPPPQLHCRFTSHLIGSCAHWDTGEGLAQRLTDWLLSSALAKNPASSSSPHPCWKKNTDVAGSIFSWRNHCHPLRVCWFGVFINVCSALSTEKWKWPQEN